MDASELIEKLKDVSGLPVKIFLDGLIYDFDIDILYNNRIDLNVNIVTGERILKYRR